MKTISRYLMTLALLITAATGAWADWTGGTYTATTNEELGAITVGADATLTINEGVTVTVSGGINANGHTLTVNGAGTLTVTGTNGANGANGGAFTGGAGGIGSAGFTGTLIVDGATVNVTGGNGGNGGTGLSDGGRGGNGAAGVSGSITLNSGSVTVTGGAGGNGGHGGLRDGSRGSAGQAVTETITASTAEESDDNSTWTAISGNTSSKRYVRAESTAPAVEVTINDTKTEASFDMPQYDVTATYTIKRDMTVDMTTKVGDGTDGVRFRIKKNAQSKYELVEEGANQPEVMDEIDAQNPTEVPAAGYTLQLQKLADDGETWENVSDYSVGTFRYVVTGQGDYDGIVYTNTFELFEGYVVKIPANEYITFFQKEMLYVEDEDVKIYTIVSVSDDEATATATEISVTSPNMPVLVKNNSAEDKNVLLIPTTEKSPDAVFVYNGFKGTLEATQIAASDDTQNNYAFNGMQFVWVKNAIDIDANKAWLEVPASNTAQARALTIVFSSETTGVELVPAFTTEGEGEWYDLNGRKLGKKPTVKGVYILRQADGKNTKKVAVE